MKMCVLGWFSCPSQGLHINASTGLVYQTKITEWGMPFHPILLYVST